MNNLSKKIETITIFADYLERNAKEHAKIAKESDDLEEIQNSMFFLTDYNEVADKLLKIINEYADKTGYEA